MPKPVTMSLDQQKAQAKAQCDDWNSRFAPGSTVVSYEELLGRGETHRGKTSGGAFVMSCQPVIFVDGISGTVSLDHCTPVEPGTDLDPPSTVASCTKAEMMAPVRAEREPSLEDKADCYDWLISQSWFSNALEAYGCIEDEDITLAILQKIRQA